MKECRNTSVDISWDLSEYSWNNDDDEVQYRIILGKNFILSNKFCTIFYLDNENIGVVNKTKYILQDLKPNTSYNLQIQYITFHGDSVRSDSIIFRTDDECKFKKYFLF